MNKVPFACENNQLLIANKNCEKIVAIAGNTPCYIYDSETIFATIKHLKNMLPGNVKLHYAIKANPFAPLVCKIANWVDGLDVASHQELQLALATNINAAQISIAGPGKSANDIAAAIASGAVINVESTNELDKIYRYCQHHKTKANIAIRINPNFALKGAGMQMSGGAKPFGIDAEIAVDVLKGLVQSLVTFKGLHIFAGSQNLHATALIETHNLVFKLAFELLSDANISATQINIGGGFGVPYFANDQPLDTKAVCDNLHRLCAQYQQPLNHAEIHLELGRYLVANAGVYLARIVDKKQSRGKSYLVTDGGLHHHLANSGNFGQVIRKNYPVLLANRIESDITETVDVVGPLCTPLDIMASQVNLPQAKIGDLFAVMQSGAYGASASPQNFLSQPKVQEILL